MAKMTKTFAVLALLAVVTFFLAANIWGYDLWAPDEPRFGEVAREMLESGDWVVLHVNGRPYTEKPPLLFWAISALSLPFGDVTETTARIPSVVAAVVMVMFTYVLAKRLYDGRVAFWSAVVLMTSTRFWWQARTVQTDMLLAACLTVALYAFWCWSQEKRTVHLVAFYAAIAAAVYAKGPPGLVFPVLMVLVFFWRRKEERRGLHLILGLAAVGVVIGLWLVPARIMGSAQAGAAAEHALASNLFRNTIGRFFLGESKSQPPWYYLGTLPVDLFPWTLFVPWCLPWVWRRRKEGAPMRLLLSWVIPAFIFFSICTGKRAQYLLPLFPAFAILLARSVLDLVESDRLRWRKGVAYAWVVVLIGVVGVSLFMAMGPAARLVEAAVGPIAVHDMPRGGLLAAFGVIFLVVALYELGRGMLVRVHMVVAVEFAVLLLVCSFAIFPWLNAYKSAREFCAPARRLAETGHEYELYSLCFSREEYIFYSRHFHKRVLMDQLPVAFPPDTDPEVVGQVQRQLAGLLVAGAASVPLERSYPATDAEFQALSKVVEGVFDAARGNDELVARIEDGLRKEVDDFARAFLGSAGAQPPPALAFVQEQDWRWLVGIAPALRECALIGADQVGRRSVFLLANPTAAQLPAAIPRNTGWALHETEPLIRLYSGRTNGESDSRYGHVPGGGPIGHRRLG